MSKGMINHLSKEFSDKSSDERKEVFDHLVKAPVMYSDFTGCRVNGKQAVTFRSSKSVEYLCDALSVIETGKANGENIYNTVSNIFA